MQEMIFEEISQVGGMRNKGNVIVFYTPPDQTLSFSNRGDCSLLYVHEENLPIYSCPNGESAPS